MRVNLRQLVLFEILYRLVAGAFYIRLVNLLLKISLRAAGYSYLTMSNLAAFLLRPVTVGCAMVLVLVGAFLMVVELGGLLTAYQAAAYSRRIDVVSIVRGAVGKAVDGAVKAELAAFFACPGQLSDDEQHGPSAAFDPGQAGELRDGRDLEPEGRTGRACGGSGRSGGDRDSHHAGVFRVHGGAETVPGRGQAQCGAGERALAESPGAAVSAGTP